MGRWSTLKDSWMVRKAWSYHRHVLRVTMEYSIPWYGSFQYKLALWESWGGNGEIWEVAAIQQTRKEGTNVIWCRWSTRQGCDHQVGFMHCSRAVLLLLLFLCLLPTMKKCIDFLPLVSWCLEWGGGILSLSCCHDCRGWNVFQIHSSTVLKPPPVPEQLDVLFTFFVLIFQAVFYA